MDMRKPPSDPEVIKLYLHALDVCHRAGKLCGYASENAAGARAALDQGFDFVMASSDRAMMVASATEIVTTVRNAARLGAVRMARRSRRDPH